MVLGLATSNKIWLALFAGVFIVFALLSSFVFPRRRPDFPGEQGRKWFIIGTLALFVAMLFAVNVFAKEEEEPHAERAAETETTTQPGITDSTPTETAPTETAPTETTGTAEGDPAAGKPLFTSQGCGGCHAFGPAGTNAAVGPNLDEALQGDDAASISEAIVDPNAEVAEGYAEGIMPDDYDQKLSDEQLADLVAFLSTS